MRTKTIRRSATSRKKSLEVEDDLLGKGNQPSHGYAAEAVCIGRGAERLKVMLGLTYVAEVNEGSRG